MGRSRFQETGSNYKGKFEEGRARENFKAIKHTFDLSDTVSLEGCLNLEESLKLERVLAQFTCSSNTLYQSSLVSSVSANNILEGISPSRELSLIGSMSQPRNDADIASAKNSLTQLLRNPQVKSVDASKMLVLITMVGSVGPLRALVDADASVQSVIGIGLQIYAREGRKPALGLDDSWFDLYAGNVSFSDALDPFLPIKAIKSRNFVMVKRRQQREEVVVQKKMIRPSSWLEDGWGIGTWWGKFIMAISSPMFALGLENKRVNLAVNVKPQAITSY